MTEKEKQIQAAIGSRERIHFYVRDWKEGQLDDHLVDILEQLGVYVYDDLTFEGSDTYGYIISDKELTEEQVDKLCEDEAR